MGKEAEVVLYSDGGSDGQRSAAGACIVRIPARKFEANLIVYLGEGTNNEGEISAALLGFSLLQLLNETGSGVSSVRWVSDSEYSLKSGTGYINSWQKNGWKTAAKQPVKNQGLWRTYLQLTSGLSITPEHVRGHTGHPENEACDSAVNWASKNAEDYLAESSGDFVTAPLSDDGDTPWLLVDGREFIAKLRGNENREPDPEVCRLLVEKLRPVAWDKIQSQKTPRASTTRSGADLSLLWTKLSEARRIAQSLSPQSTQAAAVAKKIEKILEQK